MEDSAGTESGLRRPNMEAEREREDEEDEEDEREMSREIGAHLEQGMEDCRLDLDEDDSDDDEHGGGTPRNAAPPPKHFLTSTPFVGGDRSAVDEGGLSVQVEEGSLGPETPAAAAAGDHLGLERRYLEANRDEQLMVLYEARGHEIARLQRRNRELEEEAGEDRRRLHHDKTMLADEKRRLEAEVDGLKHTLDSVSEEASNLRQELGDARQAARRQEAQKDELRARCEDSETTVQHLQQQLVELQKRDTLLRAREQKDAIVSSLRQRHEAEVQGFKDELDSVTRARNQAERKLDELQTRLEERERSHDVALSEKCNLVDDLNGRLSEAQRRLAQAVSSARAASAADAMNLVSDEGGGPSSLEEIIQLRTALSEATHAREEQERRLRDQADETSELRAKLTAASARLGEAAEAKSQLRAKEDQARRAEERQRELEAHLSQLKDEVDELRLQVVRSSSAESAGRSSSEAALEELRRSLRDRGEEVRKAREDGQRMEREMQDELGRLQSLNVDLTNSLSQAHRRLQAEQAELRKVHAELQEQVARNRTAPTSSSSSSEASLREQLEAKTAELQTMQERVKDLIRQWEEHAETIKANHSKERQELEAVTGKYRTLKKKVKARDARMQQHYRGQETALRDSFQNVLQQYKLKLETAYDNRGKEIEAELLDMRRQFDEAQRQFEDGQQRPHHQKATSGAGAVPRRRLQQQQQQQQQRQQFSSDEENSRPLSSRSEQMARIFDEATRDARQLLRKAPSRPPHQHRRAL